MSETEQVIKYRKRAIEAEKALAEKDAEIARLTQDLKEANDKLLEVML